jgi:hypothetical protein
MERQASNFNIRSLCTKSAYELNEYQRLRSLHINNTISCQIQFTFPTGCVGEYDKFYETLRNISELLLTSHNCFLQRYTKSTGRLFYLNLIFISFLCHNGTCGSVMFEALCYKLGSRGFETDDITECYKFTESFWPH